MVAEGADDRPGGGVGASEFEVDDLAALGGHRDIDAELFREAPGPGPAGDNRVPRGNPLAAAQDAGDPAAFEDEAVGGAGPALESAAFPGFEQGARQEPAVDAGGVRVVQRPRRPCERREHLPGLRGPDGANRTPLRARKDPLRGGLERGLLVLGDRHQQQPATGEPGAGPFRIQLGNQRRKVSVRRLAEAVADVGVAAVGCRRNDPGPRGRGAPLVASVEQQHPGTGAGEVKARGRAENAAPDDDEVVHFSPRQLMAVRFDRPS